MRDQLGLGRRTAVRPHAEHLAAERLLRAAAAAEPAPGLGRGTCAGRCTVQEGEGVEKQ